jgi:hypothetical protein
MQNIQLYIEGNRMDMFKDESVSLTQTIQNVKDIAKVFTNFTKTFSLPASKDNNKVFEHYYNYNIDDGFDARVKKLATIELNYFPFEKGKIKLEGVDMKDNKPYAYRVTFFGNTVDLKDLLGEDNLDALTWLNNFTVNYDMTTVKASLQAGKDITVDSTTYTDALVVPLITHTTRLYYDSGAHGSTDYEYPNASGGNLYYQSGTGHHHGVYWGELKYAIRVHLIIKAIEEQYGITFSTDFFNTTNDPYYNLYMWMHRKKGNIDDPNAPETYDQLVDFGLPDTSGWDHLTISGEDIIVSGLTGAHKITATFTVDPDAAETSDYTVQLLQGGTVVETFSGTAPSDVAVSADLGNGTYNLKIIISETFTVTDVQFDAADLLQPISDTFNSGSFTINATKSFSGTAQMPKMKVIDFLTGLFKLFNLTAYVEDNGTVKVETLDNFYASGTTHTIDEYVDMSQRQIDVALPYKEIDFTYKGIGTKLAIQHAQLTQGTEWGTAEYRGGDNEINEMAGGIYKVEAPFEHMKFERIKDAGNSYSDTDAQVGWFVDDNDDPYLGEALLFYPIQITNGTVISFLEQETAATGSHVQIDDYIIPSNSVSTNASTDDDNIHFNQELNEYTPSGNFAGTLFANYYTSYITDVFKVKRRLIKVKAYLPLKILRTYTLADKFVIGNQEYRINSITTNLGTGESDLELLNIV